MLNLKITFLQLKLFKLINKNELKQKSTYGIRRTDKKNRRINIHRNI